MHFPFRSAIHFELVLVKGVRSASRFFLLACRCPAVLASLVTEAISVHRIAVAPSSKAGPLCVRGLFLDTLLFSLIYLSVLLPVTHCLGDCSFIRKSRKGRIFGAGRDRRGRVQKGTGTLRVTE